MPQYVETPQMHVQTRVYRVYQFAELLPDVQAEILERDAAHPEWEWFSELIADDIACDIDGNGFVADMLPASFTLRKRDAKHHDVRYASDGYHFTVEFDADIDLAAFMREQKLAAKYRALYNAAKRGDIDAAILESRDSSHWREPRPSLATIDINYWREAETQEAYTRLVLQTNAVQDILQGVYETTKHKVRAHFQSMADYYGSEEYYRDERLYGAHADTLYFQDGQEVPYEIAQHA